MRAGLGLLAAVQLAPEALERDPAAVAKVAQGAREAGVLLRPLLGALAVSPPLIVEREHLEEIADGVPHGPRPARCRWLSPAWHTDEFPELRSGPPWVTEEMVAAQPGAGAAAAVVAARGLAEVADAIRARVDAGEPVSVVGCGTSEHGALAIAALVEEAWAAARGRRR